jgi:hypothetical protein
MLQPPLRQKIRIRRGQGLRLSLLPPSDGPKFKLRRELTPSALRALDTREKDWRLSVRQNKMGNTDDDPLQLKVSVEYLKSRERRGEDDVLEPIVPSLVMYRVREADNPERVPPLLYRPVADAEAPTWLLEARRWPRGRGVAPELEAFWSDAEQPLAGDHTIRLDSTLRVPADSQSFPIDLDPAKGTKGKVRLISLGWETQTVYAYDGQKTSEECLVVRLEYPEGRPVMVQLPKNFPAPAGQEHRFYNYKGKDYSVHQYTGIFRGITRERAELDLRALEVISVEGFRQAADRAGRLLRLKLNPPDDR